jgi:hypothetical protein
MKLIPAFFNRTRARKRAWALLAVMTLAGVGLMLLASVMNWAKENSEVNERNNEYFATSYAAEAATEKALSRMSQDYQNYGFSVVSANLSSYAATLPTSSDSAYWTNFQFSSGTTANEIGVNNTATSQSVVMSAPYTGLNMVANTYEIIASAKNINTQYLIPATVGQQIYLGTIPLFQFAIFYQNDMEICPGGAMTIAGTVHGNQNIYLQPQDGLTFSSNVSAAGNVTLGKSPEDPTSRTPTAVTFDGFDLSGVDPLNLPIGTNNTGTVTNESANAYAILKLPQAGQTPGSETGANLLYNQADMIIIISNNNTVSVTSGAAVNSQATVITNWQSFLSTNGTFDDQRDGLTVDPVVLNISNLVNWSATNTVLRPLLSSLRGSANADVESIYVDDMRSTSNQVVTTNYTSVTNYSTNAVTNASFPTAGTYAPPITSTNTTATTNGSYPSAGTYLGSVTTNTTSTTTSSYPSAGTYLGSVTTNTVSVVNSHTHPNAGTYVGLITTNGSGSSKTYSYSSISGYTYNAISSYSCNAISSYTYNAISHSYATNTSYLTNWPIVSQPGIVLSNGAVLPPQGLSIATPDPAYIVGNWNVKLTTSGTSDAGTASTANSLPSAIFADAITVLSSAWNPANSTLALGSRTATSDTVNAAFLTGNVPSDGAYYSGGVENFPRFLENWSGQTFTYNGSMVCMFASQIATAPWPGTGSVYDPPTRTWAFDTNFTNPNKQPHMMPQVTSVQRGQWVLLKPYTTSF